MRPQLARSGLKSAQWRVCLSMWPGPWALLPASARLRMQTSERPGDRRYIAGEVIQPGSYDFPSGARLHDASVNWPNQFKCVVFWCGLRCCARVNIEPQQRLKVRFVI